jgi:hypothetical protein
MRNIGEMALRVKGIVSAAYAVLGLGYPCWLLFARHLMPYSPKGD